MIIRGMRTDREGKPMPIHNRENLHALATFREAHHVAASFDRHESGIDETLLFIDRTFVVQRVRRLGQHLTKDLLLTPLLKSTMNRFVIRVALGQEIPLRPSVQNPEHGFQDGPAGDGFSDQGDYPGCTPRGSGPEFAPIGHRATAACRNL